MLDELVLLGRIRVSRGLYVTIECRNGVQWVLQEGDVSRWDPLEGRQVVVTGVPCDPELRSCFAPPRGSSHLRATTVQEPSSDAAIMEVSRRRRMIVRYAWEPDGAPDDPALFAIAESGERFRVCNRPEGAASGDDVHVTVLAHTVQRSAHAPAPVPDLWIHETDSTYVGEWRHGAPHGRGICSWWYGEGYGGEWRDGHPHGEGTRVDARGVVYAGQWQNGQRHGQGVRTWPDGGRYVGAWRDDHEHGHGTLTRADGETYVGAWRGGLMAGLGVLTKPDGEIYVGERLDHVRHGQGILVGADGSRHEGIWHRGDFVRAAPVELPDDLLDRVPRAGSPRHPA